MRNRRPARTRVALESLERRDCPAVVGIAADQTLQEAGGPGSLAVRLAAPDLKPVVVGYVLGGEASYGRDYRLTVGGQTLVGPTGTLTFKPGETLKTITVTPVDDLLREGTERLTVTLTPQQNATIGARTAKVTFLDNDQYTAWIGGPARVVAGESPTYSVHLSSPATKPETIYVSTVAQSASATSDFRPLTRLPVIFNPGESTRLFKVTTLPNTAGETDEVFTIRAEAVSAGFPPIVPFAVTIVGNGTAAPPVVSVGPASVTEGNSGTATAWFTVSLSWPSASPVTVSYATADATATTADQDYEAVAPTLLTFAPGETSKSVGVTVVGDTRPEPNETFSLIVSDAVNPGQQLARALGTILDDDSGAPPPAQQAAWTIMVYMTGENLNTFARDDINEMEKFLSTLPAGPGVNIVVSWDQPLASMGTAYGTGGGTQAAWRTYGRSLLTADATGTIASTFDLSFGERNTGDPAVLVDFMKWSAQKAPATNYALQLWGHGGGLDGSQFDSESGGDALTINEIGTALGATGIPAVKLVSYDNCLMAMAEVGVAVASQFTGQFVASEELVNGAGQDYRTAYAALASSPAGVTSQSLAAGMVASYQTQYAGDPSKCDTFSSVATTGYTQLTSALAQFVLATDALTAGNRTTLRTLISTAPSIGYDVASFRDLGSFMSRVVGSAALPQSVRTAASAVNAALATMVSAKTADARSSSGMSIYLPTSADSYLGTYASTATAFCQATGWDRFARWIATGTRAATSATTVTGARPVFLPGTRAFAEARATAFHWASYGAASGAGAEAADDARGRGRAVSSRGRS